MIYELFAQVISYLIC